MGDDCMLSARDVYCLILPPPRLSILVLRVAQIAIEGVFYSLNWVHDNIQMVNTLVKEQGSKLNFCL